MDTIDPEAEIREIDLKLPFNRAFDECMLAIQTFTFREIEQFDPDRFFNQDHDRDRKFSLRV